MISTAVEQIMELEDLKIHLILQCEDDPNEMSSFFNWYLQARPADMDIKERIKILITAVEDCKPEYIDIINKLLILV